MSNNLQTFIRIDLIQNTANEIKKIAQSLDDLNAKQATSHAKVMQRLNDEKLAYHKKIADIKSASIEVNKNAAISIEAERRKTREIERNAKKILDSDKVNNQIRLVNAKTQSSKELADYKELIRQKKDTEKQALAEQRAIKDRARREEIAAEREKNRIIRDEQRAARRQLAEKRAKNYEGVSLSRAGMFYVTAPTMLAGTLSLRNAMDLETMKSQTDMMYGEDAKRVRKSLMDYAVSSAFGIEEALLMSTMLKPAQRNLGITSNEEMVKLVKNIGNAMIPTVRPVHMYEVVNQLGQIGQKNFAEARQDISALVSRTFPIEEMLMNLTGKTSQQIRQETGRNVPAQLIFKAIVEYANSEKVLRTLSERQDTLVQSYQNFAESMKLASGQAGLSISKQFQIPSILNAASDKLKNLALSEDSSDRNLAATIAGVGTLAAFSVAVAMPLSFLYFNWKRIGMFLTAGKAGKSAMGLFGSTVLSITGATMALSSVYNFMKDDKDKDLFTKLEENAVELSLAGVLLYSTMKKYAASLIASMAAMRATVFASAATMFGSLGLFAAGGAAAYGGYRFGEFLKTPQGSTFTDKVLDAYYYAKGENNMTTEALGYNKPEEIERVMEKQTQLNLIVNNNISGYGQGKPNIQTSASAVNQGKSVKAKNPIVKIVGYQSGSTDYWQGD